MNENPRSCLRKILDAALKAVAPDEAVLRHMSFNDGKLVVDGREFDLTSGKTRVVGAGKGVAPMAQALESLLGDRIDDGVVVAKYGHALPLQRIRLLEAAHPVPDEAGEAAARTVLDVAGQSTPDDVLIVLLTGGASALLPAPATGISLADLQKTTSLLLASGAEIGEVNAVRKHLSRLAGGRLAQAANGAQVISVVVSDVIGDDLSSIASGPTVPDESAYADCLAILSRYNLAGKAPSAVIEILQAGAAGKIPETPKPADAIFEKVHASLVGTNSQALAAAAAEAEELGFAPQILPEPMRGEASETARKLIHKAKKLQERLAPEDRPICLLAGGETTVAIKGAGLGGRNQEMALAAAIELAGSKGIAALFAGTDGTDGPTDAAGGFAFANSAVKMGGVEKAAEFLANNDSNTALRLGEDLLVTGPTRTNVMDVVIILIYPNSQS